MEMPDLTDGGKYVSIAEASNIMGCSQQNISYHVAKGNLKDVRRFGKTSFKRPYMLINKAEVLELSKNIVGRRFKRKKNIQCACGCGAWFEPSSPRQKFKSRECQVTEYNRNRLAKAHAARV